MGHSEQVQARKLGSGTRLFSGAPAPHSRFQPELSLVRRSGGQPTFFQAVTRSSPRTVAPRRSATSATAVDCC